MKNVRVQKGRKTKNIFIVDQIKKEEKEKIPEEDPTDKPACTLIKEPIEYRAHRKKVTIF